MPIARRFFFRLVFAVLSFLPAVAREASLAVSVHGQVDPSYKRTKRSDGSFAPERYVIANGGPFPGTRRDASSSEISYPTIAGVVAQHLGSQNYFLANKAADADLLIVIHWGSTIPFDHDSYGLAVDRLAGAMNNLNESSRLSNPTQQAPRGEGGMMEGWVGGPSFATDQLEYTLAMVQMGNRDRDMANLRNARILGYVDAINDRREMSTWADIGDVNRELVSDVEEERYYVVIGAYDFKTLQREERQVVRWITRISISAQGNRFDERVAQMVASAASTLGRRSDLQRRFYRNPRVDLGDTQFLGEAVVPAPVVEEK